MVGLKFKPVAIGRLERFVADAAMGRGWDAAGGGRRRRNQARRHHRLRSGRAWPAPANWPATAWR